MRKIIKNISFGLLTAGLIVGTALPTFAAYDEASGDAGSTRVYCEVGFNGGTSYAKVSAKFITISNFSFSNNLNINSWSAISPCMNL